MPRPRVPKLSPERIADAAIALIDEGGVFGIVPLAKRLKVTPSSLYNHVDGRDGIIELMRRRLIERYEVGIDRSEPWDGIVGQVVRGQVRMYSAHPRVLPLLVGKTVTDPAVIEVYDTVAVALIDAGFPEGDIVALIAALDAFALGAGLDYSGAEDAWQADPGTSVLGRLVPAAARGSARSDRAFELGLELLLDGLRRRLAVVEG